MESKRCTKCGEVKPLSEFNRDGAHSDGRRSCCKACDSLRKRSKCNTVPADITEKCCSRCGEVKPISEFYRDKRADDGLFSHCKACHLGYGKVWRAGNPRRVVTEKKCAACGVVKPASEFQKCRLTVDGLQRVCRDCANAARREGYHRLMSDDDYREAYNERKRVEYWLNPEPHRNAAREWAREHYDPEKNREKTRRWIATHPEYNWRRDNPEKNRALAARYHARKKGAAGWDYTTAEHIAWRWEMWGGRCYICGAPAEATDHVKPLAAGGGHWPCNLRPICKSCNSRKRDQWPSEYVYG